MAVTTEYDGPERRHRTFYESICHPRLRIIEEQQLSVNEKLAGVVPRLDHIQDTQKNVVRQLGEVRERIFNGLSEVPSRIEELDKRMTAKVESQQRVLVGILVSVLLGLGALFLQNMVDSARIRAHLEQGPTIEIQTE